MDVWKHFIITIIGQVFGRPKTRWKDNGIKYSLHIDVEGVRVEEKYFFNFNYCRIPKIKSLMVII